MSTTLPAVNADSSKQLPATARKTIQQHLESPAFIEAVKKALPTHLTPERFIRVAITAMTKTPKLAQCSQQSLFSCLLSLSQYGLEPDGRRAHLIPYENRKLGVVECQLIIDWKGLAELAMRSGLVANLHADVVYKGDVFEYNAGNLSKHIPWFLRTDSDKPSERGEIYAVYALANFKDDTSKCDVLSIDEVSAIRARSRAGASGPWVSDFNEMAKKTAFRRLSKWLPLSPEFRDASENDDDVIDIPSAAAKPTLSSLLASDGAEAFQIEQAPTAETAEKGAE